MSIASTLPTAHLTSIASARRGSPLPAEVLAQLVAGFLSDGVALLPGLMREEVPIMRELMDKQFDDPSIAATHVRDDISLCRAFELDVAFRDLLVMEPIISIMEALLGPDCHMIAQNFLRTPPGRAIDTWHVDDSVFFPLPENISQHPVPPPPVYVHAFFLLSDVLDDEHGPTQLVPGSHLSGRQPAANLMYRGQGPVSILGQAGDVYLHHNQTWHRGAPNTSNQPRHLMSTAYGRRWASQRLWPFVDYQLPAQVMSGADERLLRVLGRHPRGNYA